MGVNSEISSKKELPKRLVNPGMTILKYMMITILAAKIVENRRGYFPVLEYEKKIIVNCRGRYGKKERQIYQDIS